MSDILEEAYTLRDSLIEPAAKQRAEADLIGIFPMPQLTPIEDFLALAEKILAVEEAKEQLRLAQARLDEHVPKRCMELAEE